jgi:integrase
VSGFTHVRRKLTIDTGFFSSNNPASKVKVSVPDNSRIRFLSREEAGKLLKALKLRSEELHNLAFISLNCGLRAGELFNLTWDCVDWDKKLLTIKDPKNKKTRYAYPPDSVIEILQEISKLSVSDLVFPDKRNGQMRGQVSHIFRKTVKQLGLNNGATDRRDKVVFHTLRHTFASWLVEAGTDLYTVKELMGHSSIKMTERYAHLSPNKLRAAMGIFS